MANPRRRSRTRRVLTGLCVSAATFAVLGVAVEIGVRVFVPAEIFTAFKPIYRPDEIAGYTLSKNWSGDAFGAPVRTNRLGYRGANWAPRAAPGTLRVALVGDSHAFGFGVAEDEAIGAELGRRLGARLGRPCEVLSFALPGYNAEQQLKALRGYALPSNPDVVVVLMCENDHEPSRWADSEGWLHRGSEEPWQRPVPLASERHLLRGSHAFLYFKLLWRRARAAKSHAPAGPDPNWMTQVGQVPVSDELRKRVAEPLAAMVAACRAERVPILLTALASRPDYRRVLRDLGGATGVPMVELLTLFPEVRSWAELFRRFGLGWNDHLNAEGHRRWAEAIAARVIDSGSVPK